MPDRGVARRSVKRRRIFRLRVKSDAPSMIRRFKLLDFLPTDPMPVELDWELWVLDQLEQASKKEMDARGISPQDQVYYLGFLKRLWERRVHFSFLTFTEEKEILITEYKLRGWDETTLRALQAIAESWALIKGAPWLRAPHIIFFENWNYTEPPSMSLLFSEPWTYDEPPSMTLKFSEPWSPSEPSMTTQIFVEAWSS